MLKDVNNPIDCELQKSSSTFEPNLNKSPQILFWSYRSSMAGTKQKVLLFIALFPYIILYYIFIFKPSNIIFCFSESMSMVCIILL